LLEDINNLEYQLPKTEGSIKLSPDERQVLVAALNDPAQLNERSLLTWGQVKKLLKLSPRAKFNLERTSKNGIYGNRPT